MPILNVMRDALPLYWKDQGLTGTAVEVGVHRGGFSACILKQWPGHLHVIDPWLHQLDQIDLLNGTPAEMEQNYAIACQTLAPWTSTGRCTIHRQFSVEAAQSDWAHDLDVVYIDARHDYQSVYADLVAWFPRVRKGGIIAGHDYLDGFVEGNPTDFGVKSAVQKFFGDLGYDLEHDILIQPDNYPSFMVVVK